MQALLPSLPVWTLVDLNRARSNTAAAVGGKLLEKLLPEGAENTGEMVQATLDGLSGMTGSAGTVLASLAHVASRVLAAPVEWLARPGRVNLSVGNVTCIRNAARFDLVELLQRAIGELNLPNLSLVQPGITFEEAKRYYSWHGLLIEFYAASSRSGLHPHYVALDREPRKQQLVRSSMALHVLDTASQ